MIGLHIDTAAHAIGDALGLLEDFLQHEMRITALFNLSEGDINGLDFR